MITAILKLQACTTKKARFGFVRKKDQAHGIAKGVVKYYSATAPTWAQLRRAVRAYGNGVMGFSAIYAETVVSYREFASEKTYTTIAPKPPGWRPDDIRPADNSIGGNTK